MEICRSKRELRPMSGLNFSEVVPPRCSGLHSKVFIYPRDRRRSVHSGANAPVASQPPPGRPRGFLALFLMDTVYFKSYSQSAVQNETCSISLMVGPGGFEPPTSRFLNRKRAYQLRLSAELMLA